MQAASSSNDNAAAELGIMFDDDPLSPFDFQGAEIDGDELLEALSSDGGSIFDGIDVEKDADMIIENTDDTAITAPSFTTSTTAQPIQSVGSDMLFSFDVATFPAESPSRNRYKPISGRKNRKKSTRDIPSQPLFSGENSRSQSDYDGMSDGDDVSVSDVASACSAPADLMALCGLYDDPAKAPDLESAMNMWFKQQQNMVDEETLKIRQRQQELLQEERQLQRAASSAQQRPRRRKSDGTLPTMDEMRLIMRGNGEGSISSGGSIESMFVGENIMSSSDGTGNQNIQMKRRKSEPCMMDMFGMQAALNMDQDGNTQGNNNLGIPTKAAKKATEKKSPKKKKKPEELAGPTEIPLPDKPDPEILKLDPSKIMAKLQESMARTSSSMKQLQEWDRANGLPKSHSQTMTNSNRSRNQLSEGVTTLRKSLSDVLGVFGAR